MDHFSAEWTFHQIIDTHLFHVVAALLVGGDHLLGFSLDPGCRHRIKGKNCGLPAMLFF